MRFAYLPNCIAKDTTYIRSVKYLFNKHFFIGYAVDKLFYLPPFGAFYQHPTSILSIKINLLIKKIMETINKDEVNTINENLIHKKNLSISAIILVIVAIGIIYAETMITDQQSSLKMGLLFAGIVVGITGIIKLISGKKVILYKGTGSPVKNYNLFFDNHEMRNLRQAMESKQFDDLSKLKPVQGDKAGIKLDLMVSDDAQYVSAQILEFIPFTYEAVTPHMNYFENEAATLSKAVTTVAATQKN